MPKEKCLGFKEVAPTIHRISIYQTNARIYIIGSDFSQSYYRLLKIDRTEPKSLLIDDDNRKYTEKEMDEILKMIDGGNTNSVNKTSGLQKTVSSFGIVGFVRFLEGYYILLITKRRKVAIIGGHFIYKIEDAVLLYISPTANKLNPEESRYVKTFLNVDLSSNFYFSYSYDLTNTLQTLMRLHPTQPPSATKFVWNSHLLKDFKHRVHPEWVLPVVHGFISQNCINVFGRSLYITLIARRSRYYAGTRYLKRGMDDLGNVANDVETEQIVYESYTISHRTGKYTSFVQLRGSVPGFWSQDIQGVKPKPPIRIDRGSPFFVGAARHFNSCLARYGCPVVIFNLVKKKEKRAHESLLSHELEGSVIYLNQFLPPDFKIHYLHCDMARITRSKERSIIDLLENLSKRVVKLNGFFHSGYELACNQVRSNPDWEGMGGRFYTPDTPGRDQTGVVRVNCVDCLDRTNTAQFMIGKCALGFQLYALGVVDNPQLNFDSDIVKMFEEMYEAHGDTIALQYGGSNLVHRIRTYRKISPITSHGRDIMQTVARYYNNAFADQDKQMAINLFLGVYIPEDNTSHLWELSTDYYHHHLFTTSLVCPRPLSYTKWWTDDVIMSLPRPVFEAQGIVTDNISSHLQVNLSNSPLDEYIKPKCVKKVPSLSYKYEEFYSPNELTVLHKLFSYTLNSQYSTTEYMPSDATDMSPFTVRTRSSGQGKVVQGKKLAAERKTIGGTPAQPGSDEDDDELSDNSSDSDTDSLLGGIANYRESYLSLGTSGKHVNTPKHASTLSTTNIRYGFDLEEPDTSSLSLYQTTELSYQQCFADANHCEKLTVEKASNDLKNWITPSPEYFDNQSSSLPTVSDESLRIYSDSVLVSKYGPKDPSATCMELYYLYEQPLSIPRYDPLF